MIHSSTGYELDESLIPPQSPKTLKAVVNKCATQYNWYTHLQEDRTHHLKSQHLILLKPMLFNELVL